MRDQRSLEHSDGVELSPARVSRGTGRVLDLLSIYLKLPADKDHWLSEEDSPSVVVGVGVLVVPPPPVLSGGSIGAGGSIGDSNIKLELSSED